MAVYLLLRFMLMTSHPRLENRGVPGHNHLKHYIFNYLNNFITGMTIAIAWPSFTFRVEIINGIYYFAAVRAS